MAQAFKSIKQGLTEAIVHAKGNVISVKLYQPKNVDVSDLRGRLGKSGHSLNLVFNHKSNSR